MYLHLVKFDGEKWMAACTVAPGETYPIGFEQDDVLSDGTAFGFEPIEFTKLIPWLNDAIKSVTESRDEDFEFKPGYYRLYAPHIHFGESLEDPEENLVV